MDPNLEKTSRINWTVLVVCHLAAVLLYGTWYFNQEMVASKDYSRVMQYSEDAPVQLWKQLDYAAFKALNGSLRDNSSARYFWALTNHRAFDLVQATLVGLLYAVFVFRGKSGEERVKRVQAGFYMAVCTVIGLQFFHFTLFFFNRMSPTMIPVEGAIRLSLMEHITWGVKDISARSFPGDHSAFLFLITIFIFYNAGWRFGIVSSVLTVLGILPRLVGGAHWMTDVVVGGGTIALVVASWALATPLREKGLALSLRPSLFLMAICGRFIPALRPPDSVISSGESIPNESEMSEEPVHKNRNLKENLYLFFTGVCMGAADIVPGVSGGTMAFIMGIYEELLNAIKSVNIRLLRLMLKFRIKECFAHVPWKFLLVLGSGLLITLKLLANVIHKVLGDSTGKMYLYAFFFGLVLASIVALSRHVKWNLPAVIAFVVGTIVAWIIVGLLPAEMSHSTPVIFFSGMIAIVAMILPGISGSFILLILGQYAFVVEALKNLDIKVFVVFAAGAGIGLLGFARVLSWLLARFHAVTLAALIGFMAGSLRKIWPFKDLTNTTFITDRHGKEIPIVEPNRWPEMSGNEVWISLGLAVLGVAVIFAMELIHKRMKAGQTEA